MSLNTRVLRRREVKDILAGKGGRVSCVEEVELKSVYQPTNLRASLSLSLFQTVGHSLNDINFKLDRSLEHVSKFYDLYPKDNANISDIVPKHQKWTNSQIRYQIPNFGTKRTKIVPKGQMCLNLLCDVNSNGFPWLFRSELLRHHSWTHIKHVYHDSIAPSPIFSYSSGNTTDLMSNSRLLRIDTVQYGHICSSVRFLYSNIILQGFICSIGPSTVLTTVPRTPTNIHTSRSGYN